MSSLLKRLCLGAAAAWLAIITPALLVLPILRYAVSKATVASVEGVLHAVILGSAGISLSATLPLGTDALRHTSDYMIALTSLILLITTRVNTYWVILGAAALNLCIAFIPGSQ